MNDYNDNQNHEPLPLKSKSIHLPTGMESFDNTGWTTQVMDKILEHGDPLNLKTTVRQLNIVEYDRQPCVDKLEKYYTQQQEHSSNVIPTVQRSLLPIKEEEDENNDDIFH